MILFQTLMRLEIRGLLKNSLHRKEKKNLVITGSDKISNNLQFSKYNIFLILTIIYIPLFKYFIELNNNKGHTFMTADWLINYNHGFLFLVLNIDDRYLITLSLLQDHEGR